MTSLDSKLPPAAGEAGGDSPTVPDSETTYGTELPKHIKEALRASLSRTREQNLESIKKMKQLLRRVKKSGSMDRTQKLLAKHAQEWVRKVQGHIDFCFIDEVAKTFNIPDVENESWKDFWRAGVPVNTEDVHVSGCFQARSEPKRSAQRKAPSWSEHPIKIPKKPFSFMKDYNLIRAWDDLEKRIGKNVREIAEGDLKSCPILAFGVEQGEYAIIEGIKIFKKLRSCLDFREANSYCDQQEIMHLNGVPVVAATVAALICGNPDLRTPVKQTKRDVNKDVAKELAELFKHDLQRRIINENKAVYRRRRVKIAKKDKKSYYHQFGVRDPSMVAYAFWDPRSKKWRFFEAECLDFGSIHAIWFPVRVASVNEKIINALGIPCVVYIDDTILVCDEEIAKEQEELCDLFYELAGFKMSVEKDESMRTQDVVKVLGVEFQEGSTPFAMQMKIPEVKIREALECAAELKKALRKRGANAKMFERLHGKAIFCSSLKPLIGQGFIRQLAVWSCKAEFYTMLNKGAIKPLIECVSAVEKALSTVDRVELSPETLSREVIKMTSDAANPDKPMLGGMKSDGSLAWKLDWSSAFEVKFWGKCRFAKRIESHIGIWELMAVAINVRLAKEHLREKKLYSFVDNLGDVRILVKLTSKCPICQAIAAFIAADLESINCDPYFIYINTERNPSDFLTRPEKLFRLISLFPRISILNLKNKRLFISDIVTGIIKWINKFEGDTV